jgi:hypothetical protein
MSFVEDTAVVSLPKFILTSIPATTTFVLFGMLATAFFANQRKLDQEEVLMTVHGVPSQQLIVNTRSPHVSVYIQALVT